jgi:hypothetical protein
MTTTATLSFALGQVGVPGGMASIEGSAEESAHNVPVNGSTVRSGLDAMVATDRINRSSMEGTVKALAQARRLP